MSPTPKPKQGVAKFDYFLRLLYAGQAHFLGRIVLEVRTEEQAMRLLAWGEDALRIDGSKPKGAPANRWGLDLSQPVPGYFAVIGGTRAIQEPEARMLRVQILAQLSNLAGDYPGIGGEMIMAALRSNAFPATDLAIITLNKWPRELWPPGAMEIVRARSAESE